MRIIYNVSGSERKRLVTLIAEFAECEAQYLGAPSFVYQVGDFTIDRNGIVTFDDSANCEMIEQLVERLYEKGFTPQATEQEETSLCISMPSNLFTDTALVNLKNLLDAKGSLIKKALGVNETPFKLEDDKVCFPWFTSEVAPEEVRTYEYFICKLCEMARTKKRITAKEKEVENEKYAFRCFLLRLGFIGEEYKAARKILLRNLEGDAANKGGQPKEVEG